jgi:hypothetical protein
VEILQSKEVGMNDRELPCNRILFGAHDVFTGLETLA